MKQTATTAPQLGAVGLKSLVVVKAIDLFPLRRRAAEVIFETA